MEVSQAGAEAAGGSVASEEATLRVPLSVIRPLQGSGGGRCPGPEPSLFFGFGCAKIIEHQFGVTISQGVLLRPGRGTVGRCLPSISSTVSLILRVFLELLSGVGTAQEAEWSLSRLSRKTKRFLFGLLPIFEVLLILFF